jgi:hypothetical protein
VVSDLAWLLVPRDAVRFSSGHEHQSFGHFLLCRTAGQGRPMWILMPDEERPTLSRRPSTSILRRVSRETNAARLHTKRWGCDQQAGQHRATATVRPGRRCFRMTATSSPWRQGQNQRSPCTPARSPSSNLASGIQSISGEIARWRTRPERALPPTALLSSARGNEEHHAH